MRRRRRHGAAGFRALSRRGRSDRVSLPDRSRVFRASGRSKTSERPVHLPEPQDEPRRPSIAKLTESIENFVLETRVRHRIGSPARLRSQATEASTAPLGVAVLDEQRPKTRVARMEAKPSLRKPPVAGARA